MNNFNYNQLFKLYARPTKFLALRIVGGILASFLIMTPCIIIGTPIFIVIAVLVMIIPPVTIVFLSVRKFHKEIEEIKEKENLHFKGTIPYNFFQ